MTNDSRIDGYWEATVRNVCVTRTQPEGACRGEQERKRGHVIRVPGMKTETCVKALAEIVGGEYL
jgi:hypothetical protein